MNRYQPRIPTASALGVCQFKTYVINNKSGFDCTGCGDKNVCEALRELIRDGKTESKGKK